MILLQVLGGLFHIRVAVLSVSNESNISPMKTDHTMETVICLELQLECCNLTDVLLQSLNLKFCLLVAVVAFTLFSVDH